MEALVEHAAAPATYTIAMPETRAFASVRMPWVMLGADSIMFQSGVSEATVGIRSVTATFLVATLGTTDRLGPAKSAALASIRAKISSQDLRAILVASANIRTKMAKQHVKNARLGGPRAAKVNLHAACAALENTKMTKRLQAAKNALLESIKTKMARPVARNARPVNTRTAICKRSAKIAGRGNMKTLKDQAHARIVVQAPTRIPSAILAASRARRGRIRTTTARVTAKLATEVITRTKLA
jgi:hypothetical protein